VLDTFKNMFKVPELRNKLLFTLAMILIYRVGGHLPTPGIDSVALASYFDSNDGGGLFGMVDMFVGGAFTKATIFALGIMPYISASIVIQLFGTVFPYFHKLQKEGGEGKKKITQITRYGTLLIASVQALFIAKWLNSVGVAENNPVVMEAVHGIPFIVMTIISLTAGTIFVMWLGEQITSKGIGNGISLLILIGIVSRLPQAIVGHVQGINPNDNQQILATFALLAIIIAMTAFIVSMYQATRRIPIQTPKKMVGTKMAEGQTTVLPLRLNMAGVIPIIFASSLMMITSFIVQRVDAIRDFFDTNMGQNAGNFIYNLVLSLGQGKPGYIIVFAILIILFTYFYTAIIFRPVDIAENLKRSGGFIPGIKPGTDTSDYLQKVLEYITLPGSVFLAFIAVAPFMLMGLMKVEFFFGGTSVLIVVGVALDTLQQIESHLQSRNYEGFMNKGTLKGRIGQ